MFKKKLWLFAVYTKVKCWLSKLETRIVRESDYNPAAVPMHAVKGQSVSGY